MEEKQSRVQSRQPVPILRTEKLSVSYQADNRWLQAIQDINLQIDRGQTYGLVGESGSGKTTLALAILGYLGRNARIDQGAIYLEGEDLCRLNTAQLRGIWGKKMVLVPQDPYASLNPSLKIGDQITELLVFQLNLEPRVARKMAAHLLDMVHISDPERILDSYPHQISGGMQQRVLIAMALSTEPSLVIMDEPTTSLDVTTQAVVLDLIRELIRSRNTAVLYVSHNLGVVASLCDRVAVLYAGELVEDAAVRSLFREPKHPYTIGLLKSIPRLGISKSQISLEGIEGQIPGLGERPAGCVFEPRCPLAIEICLTRPPIYQVVPGHETRCHRWEETNILFADASTSGRFPEGSLDMGASPPALVLDNLEIKFPLGRSIEEIFRREPMRYVEAVRGIDLQLDRGTTLGLVGESGSGKTTLARAVMGLVEEVNGAMALDEMSLPVKINQRSREILKRLQMVFQNPEDALNPYTTIGESLRRPLLRLLGTTRTEADRAVGQLLTQVSLPTSYADRYPAQLSGGEKQRVAIARVLASNPEIIVFDEPVTSLDVSVQASLLNLVNRLQAENQTSQLFISHNLAVVGYLADFVAVIYLGELMELTPADSLFVAPHHPYTEALLSAIPLMDPDAQETHLRLGGDIPRAMNIPDGCPFHTRCPRYLGTQCAEETPPWQETPTGKKIFCHIPYQELQAAQTSNNKFPLSAD